jgi:hypothetical protein
MAETLTELDELLLGRWHDAVGIRDALKELEERLQNRLEAVAERLRPWLDERGYVLFDVGTRNADLEVVKPTWLKTKNEPLIWISVFALFPYGFRKVEEEHPFIWLYSKGLPKNEVEPFRAELAHRLKNRPERWINDECDLYCPAGMYITSHGDKERIDLARSEETLEDFVKTNLLPMLALGDDIDAALEAVHGPLKAKKVK